MNMMINNPHVIPTARPLSKMIGECAVIAAVQVSSLGMTRLDRRASTASDIAHGAKEGTGRTNVNRLPGAEAAVDAIKAKHTAGRALIAGRTTKWGKDRRLLMNQWIMDVSTDFEVIKREHDILRDAFVARAHDWIVRAESNLGSYDVRPPTKAEIENAFSMSLELSPVPDVTAYNAAGDSALEQRMKEKFEDDIKSAYDGAQKDLMKRLAEPLDNLVTRMAKYEEREALKGKDIDVGKTGTFKSTVITNVTDIAKLLRAFNITNDPTFEAIVTKLDALEGIEHKDLIAHADLRADTAKRAADIRASLENWL